MKTTIKSIEVPAGMTGLAVEPWSKGEIYAVAADWSQAICAVLSYGEDGGIRGRGKDQTACHHGVRIDLASDGDQRKYEDGQIVLMVGSIACECGQIERSPPRL